MSIVMIVLLVLIGLLVGWLGPIIFRSERPHGLVGDLGVSVLIMLVFGGGFWFWGADALGFSKGWIKLAGSLVDPAILAGIVLWLMRR